MTLRLAARAFGVPLLIDERKAATIATVFGPRLLGAPVAVTGADLALADHWVGREKAGVVDGLVERLYERAGRLPFALVDGVAVIAVEGTLVHKGAFVGQSSGETSYEGLQAQVSIAAKTPAVRGVAFEVDSFGGEARGAFEVAEAMRALSAVKPTIAILTDYALSAGYLLASQARRIVVPKYGAAGSIGVVTMHVDESQAIEAAGLKITVIQSGARKTEGSSLAPLPDAVRAEMQARVDRMRADFAAAVAAGRRGKLTAAQALATEAGVYEGEAAVAIGLADAVGNPHEAFRAFVAAVNGTK
jgi:signal peptide peptidase SppA